MLPTSYNMSCTAVNLTVVCLWPLEAFRGPDEPESVFAGCPQSDMIVIDLALLDAFNLLHYAIHNYRSFHYLFGLAS